MIIPIASKRDILMDALSAVADLYSVLDFKTETLFLEIQSERVLTTLRG
jgi:hypothetical protein